MNIPDNYDLWEAHDREKEQALEDLPVCESGKVRTWVDTYSRIGKVRSNTFPGIAKAMAEQWGGECK